MFDLNLTCFFLISINMLNEQTKMISSMSMAYKLHEHGL